MTSAYNVAEWLETAQFLCQLAVALNVVGMSVCVAADLLRSRDVGWTGSRILIISGRCRISRAVAKFFLLPTDSGADSVADLLLSERTLMWSTPMLHTPKKEEEEKTRCLPQKGGKRVARKGRLPHPWLRHYLQVFVCVFFLSK